MFAAHPSYQGHRGQPDQHGDVGLEADTVECGEWKTGRRSEGATYALFSFTRKVTKSTGGAAGAWAQVCVVAGSVQLSCDGQIVRVHPIRHDRAKEHGAFATPNGRPRHRQDAPAGVGVKAKPLRGRPTGRALTPTP
jgi:hypothetical protein